MPYSPGIQDRSGELLAQGINQLGQGIMSGVQSWKQNEMMASQALGRFKGAVSANPDILKFLDDEQPSPNAPGDVVKAFSKLKKDGSLALKDAALLSTFADSYQSAKDNKQKQEMQAAQTQQQQFALKQAQEQKAQEDALNERLQQYSRIGQQLQGPNADMVASGYDPRYIESVKQFMGTPLAEVAKSGARVTPQMVSDYALKTKPTLDSRAEVADIRAQSAQQAMELRQAAADAAQEAKTARAETVAAKDAKKDTALAFDETKKLRDEFGAKDSARNFGIVSTQYNLAKKLAAQETPAGDMAFVYSLMKAYDPRSTVREGERADASNTGSVPDRIWQAYNKATTGEVLSPKMRTEFLKTLDDSTKTHHENMLRDAKQYESIAKKRGLDPEEVIPPEYMNWGKAPTATTTQAPAIKILSIKRVN